MCLLFYSIVLWWQFDMCFLEIHERAKQKEQNLFFPQNMEFVCNTLTEREKINWTVVQWLVLLNESVDSVLHFNEVANFTIFFCKAEES